MKRIFTLCMSLLLAGAISTQAQIVTDQGLDGNFVFIDPEGNVVEDGTVLTINTVNEDGQMVIPLSVKNVSGQKNAVSMYEVIDAKPSGDFQTCAFGNCMILPQTGYSPKNIVAGDYQESIQTEWIPEEGQYASWTATLQIHVFDITGQIKFGQMYDVPGSQIIGYGPRVTVNFVYADPAGISTATATAAPAACYGLDGRRLSGRAKGLVIERQADGTVRKYSHSK